MYYWNREYLLLLLKRMLLLNNNIMLIISKKSIPYSMPTSWGDTHPLAYPPFPRKQLLPVKNSRGLLQVTHVLTPMKTTPT